MTSSQHRLDGLPKDSVVHGYRIERILGSGAFGISYLVEHTLFHTWHVIKEYMPDNALRDDTLRVQPKSEADRSFFDWGMTSFLEEARLLHGMNHPHIVKVTDLFEANGTAYFVMPFLQGDTLREWIRSHPSPEQKDLEDIFVPLLEGLKYIHSRNLLHRDIKPENIFITEKGHPVLIDFGAARIAIGAKSRALTQVLTPHFAPIEQYASTGTFTSALDIYSLGGCMYHAITHELPVEAPGRIHDEDPQPQLSKSIWQKHYSPSFLLAIDKALSYSAKDRFQDAFEFQRALLADDPGLVSPSPDDPAQDAPRQNKPSPELPRKSEAHKITKPSLPSRKNTGFLTLFVILIGFGILVGGGYWYYSNQKEESRLEQQRVDDEAAARAEQEKVSDWLQQVERVFLGPEYDKKEKYQSLYDTDQNLFAGLFMELTLLDGEEATTESRRWAEKNKDNEVVSMLLALADHNLFANTALGYIYAFGLAGEDKNYAEGIKWYRKAAEKGDACAQNSLGWMYAEGRGVDQSDAEAVKWYRKAAEQGNAMAQNNLGWMYEIGLGVDQSNTEAVKWYRKSAEQGYANAQYRLGLMYRTGKGVAQSDTEAVKWYRKSAEQGNAFAQNNLGWMYRTGKGVAQSDTEAVKWYRKSAEQGDADAQNNLGVMYEHGKGGLTQSNTEARKWYQKSAQQGNETAQNNLRLMN